MQFPGAPKLSRALPPDPLPLEEETADVLEEERNVETMPRHRKRRRARVQIAIDQTGKPVYKWASGYTKSDLEAHKMQIRLEYGVDQMVKWPVVEIEPRAEAPKEPEQPKCETFESYASRWFELYKEPHVRKSTKAMYENGFNAHLFPAFGGRPMNEITADELQTFIVGYSNSSSSLIDKLMLILRQVFAAALDDGLIEKNPVARLKPPAGTVNERTPLKMDEVETLIKAASVHPYGLFPLLLLFTGLRRGEALGLRWGDYRGGKLAIRRGIYYDSAKTIVGDTKTKSGHRSVPVIPALAEMLDARRGADDEYIFGGAQPVPYTTMKRHWAKLREDIPVLRDVTPHRLRHTYLMLLRRAGVDAVTQQYLLGHSDYETTANIYTHIDDDDVTEAEEKVAANLSGLLPDLLPHSAIHVSPQNAQK